MGAKAMHLVWEQYPGDGAEFLVALCLADWANDRGEIIHTSITLIANKCRINRRTAQRARDRMMARGWLEEGASHSGGRGHFTTYRIPLDTVKGGLTPPFEGDKGRSDATLCGESDKGRSTTTLSGKEPPDESTTCETLLQEQKGGPTPHQVFISKTPPIPPPSEKPKNKLAALLVTEGAGLDLHADTWQQFIDHRKAIKKPLTERAGVLALRKLRQIREEGGGEAWQVINQSILGGWTGLFPLKDAQKITPAPGAPEAGVTGTPNNTRGRVYDRTRQKATHGAADEVRAARAQRHERTGRTIDA